MGILICGKACKMRGLKKIHALYGLKWNPFLPDIPNEFLIKDEATKKFCFRVEQILMDGGFAMVTGEPGTGKSVVLRQLNLHLSEIPELNVKVITRPQSGLRDFYREISQLFNIPMTASNRYGSFSKLREVWKSHIKTSLFRPVILIDEAQEACEDVLNEIRLLSSVELDSKNILAVVFAGDNRLVEKLRQSSLNPLESRIRIKHHLDKRSPSDLVQIFTNSLEAAGSPDLMTSSLIQTLAEHSMGNIRAMMTMANELLFIACENDIRKLDENLFFEISKNTQKRKRPSRD